MRKIIILFTTIYLAFSFTSCNDESLQSYLVKAQERSDFITFDLPASILQLKSDNVSNETKKALKSLKKISIVALPFKDNIEELDVERAKIETILKKSEYKSLMKIKDKRIKINLYYTGSEDSIDEIIAFGYGEKHGVGIARIIGENINPSEIIKMVKDIKFDSSSVDLKKISEMFSKNR